MVPPFSLCVCRFFLSGPPLASGGLSFLPRTFISAVRRRRIVSSATIVTESAQNLRKKKQSCQILSFPIPAGFFPSYAALPDSFPHMQPCQILSLICSLAKFFPSYAALPDPFLHNNIAECIAPK
jgi:hypothetical protein